MKEFKDILTAPFIMEMREATANMYRQGWDERNGGNISYLLNEKEVAEYIDVTKVIRTIPTGFDASALIGKIFVVSACVLGLEPAVCYGELKIKFAVTGNFVVFVNRVVVGVGSASCECLFDVGYAVSLTACGCVTEFYRNNQYGNSTGGGTTVNVVALVGNVLNVSRLGKVNVINTVCTLGQTRTAIGDKVVGS